MQTQNFYILTFCQLRSSFSLSFSKMTCQPITDDELTWSSPFVYGPTLLLISALISFKRPNPYPSKVITCLCFSVISTFVLDSCIIIARILRNEPWTFTDFAYYIGVSWIAWTVTSVQDKRIYLFWEFSVITETIIGWLKLNDMGNYIKKKKVRRKTNANHIDDQVSFGIFVTRYIVEIAIVILSWASSGQKYQEHEEIESLVTTKHTRYGTTTTTARYTYKTKLDTWPVLSFKLQVLLFLCFLLICLDVVVSVLAPRQMGHVVDEFNGWSGLLIYVGLTFTQGLLHSLEQLCWKPIRQSSSSPDIDIFFVMFPILANTLVLTFYTFYVYGLALSLVLFATTALHIYYILNSTDCVWSKLIESTISSGGLLCGCLLFGHKVATCELSPGDFVAFNMYLVQLNSVNVYNCTCNVLI